MSTQFSPVASGTSQRKGMRKGTRSCFECRKRKIRCIFEAKNSNICINCENRGSQCAEQSRERLQRAAVDSRLNLKNRVAKLEAIIESIASGAGKDEIPPKDTLLSSIETGLVDSLTPLSLSPDFNSAPIASNTSQTTDPITSIFNNAIWQSDRKSSTGTGHAEDSSQKLDPRLMAKRIRTREALLFNLLPMDLIHIILDEACSWWQTWGSSGQWGKASCPKTATKTLREFAVSALQSEDPAVVSVGLLSICVSIEYLSDRQNQEILCQVPVSAVALFKEYFERVETLIVNDSDYASTSQGIEVIVMVGKILMNLGQMKKTWFLFHKAISYCQLLGFHRALPLSDKETDAERRQRHYTWVSLCEADVYLSLQLCLPNASDCRTIPVVVFGRPGTVAFFRQETMKLSVQVIDMHQMGSSHSVENVCRIQVEVESCARAMYPSFWNSHSELTNGNISMSEYMESVCAQLWYHQLRMSLHMPLMIKSFEDESLESHRLSCLQASRDILGIYHIIRLDKSEVFSMIKPIDYQAFICAALLVLGALSYGTSPSPKQSTQQDQDRQLIDETLSVLRRAATNSNSQVASQASRGIETMSLLAKCTPPHQSVDDNCDIPLISIAVPNSGTVIISPGPLLLKQACRPKAPVESHPQPPAVLTLSNGSFADLSNQVQYNLSLGENEGFTGQGNINSMPHEFTSIDLDWASLTNMNADESWAWLNDPNGISGDMTF